MGFYKVKLLDKQEIAKNTTAFRFEKPRGFKFIPGQYMGIYFDTLVAPDPLPVKSFSFSSSPKDDFLETAMRMTDSGLKKTLTSKRKGNNVNIEGPYGQFTLHENPKRTAVFITGGIGITPVRSIIKDVLENGNKYSILVLLSNKNEDNAPYLSDFKKWESKNDKLKVVQTMTQANNKWSGETGRINRKFIKKHTQDIKQPVYYVVGVPEMVDGMVSELYKLGVSGEDVKTEDFAGY